MTITNSEIIGYDQVMHVIRKHLALRGVSEERIVDDATWRNLAIDSLDIMTLTQELEDTFGVKIDEQDAMDLQTVGQAIEYIVNARAVPAARTEGA
ncbi:acyl carrier protein [Nocardia tengchongensis]|uniref:acyl carrier protein n=1 Tax=Nocardia tengchongensis TaxID=2055889 RepID=UPI0036773135